LQRRIKNSTIANETRKTQIYTKQVFNIKDHKSIEIFMTVKIDQLIRSKRRSIAIQIKGDGSLVVKAPMRADINVINRFITQKTNWIITKQFEIKIRSQEHFNKLAKHEFESSEGVLFLGKRIKKEIEKSKLILWYKQEALKYIALRANFFIKEFNKIFFMDDFQYNKLKITSAKKRWGSCSSRRNINFSWRLIMAPTEIVDYVIAHEISHIKHRNHSKKFWNCVAKIIPDYKKHNKWLKDNGFLLAVK
jgi:predicted metal-dependent hydrolase